MSEVALIPFDPTPDEVQYLEDRIYEFNSSVTHIADGELLGFFVRDDRQSSPGLPEPADAQATETGRMRSAPVHAARYLHPPGTARRARDARRLL